MTHQTHLSTEGIWAIFSFWKWVYIVQASLELLGSCNPPALVSQAIGIIGAYYHVQLTKQNTGADFNLVVTNKPLEYITSASASGHSKRI